MPYSQKERDRIIELAVHDIRRAIETIRADEALLAYIFKRMAKAFDELWRTRPKGSFAQPGD